MFKYSAIFMLSFFLLACGQKGNLYLPEEEPATPETAEAPKVDPVPEIEQRD